MPILELIGGDATTRQLLDAARQLHPQFGIVGNAMPQLDKIRASRVAREISLREIWARIFRAVDTEVDHRKAAKALCGEFGVEYDSPGYATIAEAVQNTKKTETNWGLGLITAEDLAERVVRKGEPMPQGWDAALRERAGRQIVAMENIVDELVGAGGMPSDKKAAAPLTVKAMFHLREMGITGEVATKVVATLAKTAAERIEQAEEAKRAEEAATAEAARKAAEVAAKPAEFDEATLAAARAITAQPEPVRQTLLGAVSEAVRKAVAFLLNPSVVKPVVEEMAPPDEAALGIARVLPKDEATRNLIMADLASEMREKVVYALQWMRAQEQASAAKPEQAAPPPKPSAEEVVRQFAQLIIKKFATGEQAEIDGVVETVGVALTEAGHDPDEAGSLAGVLWYGHLNEVIVPELQKLNGDMTEDEVMVAMMERSIYHQGAMTYTHTALHPVSPTAEEGPLPAEAEERKPSEAEPKGSSTAELFARRETELEAKSLKGLQRIAAKSKLTVDVTDLKEPEAKKALIEAILDSEFPEAEEVTDETPPRRWRSPRPRGEREQPEPFLEEAPKVAAVTDTPAEAAKEEKSSEAAEAGTPTPKADPLAGLNPKARARVLKKLAAARTKKK